MKEPILYRITRPIIKVFCKLTFRPTYIGLENIKDKGSIVLAGNHTNYLDCILLISSTKRVIHFLAKDDLTKGFKKIIFNNFGIIPVNRKIHDSNALKNSINVLKENKVIGIFPEGTINRTEDIIMPFKIGAVKMANETNSYIVPFTIKGKYKPFRKNVKIEFYKPYKVSNNLDKENKKLMDKISLELAKEN